MKVRQLSLAPYGAFEDLTLRFSDAAGLHLVYGPNGAGKSTTLEALRSVLFGMAAGAQSFRFDSSRLRLRAELVRANGEAIAFTRRTATKAPLWNALDDTELEAERLAPFLGNFDRQQFVTLFGLDLETMVAGGRDLLKGEGDIGRALFGAGLGGQRLAHVMARLDEDERDLYAERSSKPRVNRALSEYGEVSKALKRATLSESALEGDRRKLTTARKEQDAAIERQRALRRRIDGLMQLARALAALGPLEDKRRARAALGEFTPFDGETSARVQRSSDERAKLLASQEERQRRVAEAEATQVHLRAEARADVLEAVPAVDALSQRRGAFRAAAEDLVQARAEHNEAQAKRGEALRRAGAERAAAATGSAADGSAADGAAATATTDELAEAADAHIERMQRAESEVKRAAREAKHAAVWLSRAQADAARSRAERAAEVAAALDDLAPCDGRASATPSPVGVPSAQQARDVWAELDALRALRLPSKSTLEAHESAWAALEDERALLAQRSGALESELRAVEAQLQELALAPEGAPPTRAEVEAARRARDAALFAAFRATLDTRRGAHRRARDAPRG
ncbi:MAG: AAA family ATPase [Planctomycetota bacterium]